MTRGLGVLVFVAVTVATVPPATADIETVADRFTTSSYSGSDGTLPWEGPWHEVGESDGPGTGIVAVTPSQRCASGSCLRIGSVDADLDGLGAWRAVDLADATSAVLSFTYRRDTKGPTGGSVSLSISDTGGVVWISLASIAIAGSGGRSSTSIDLTPWVGTVVRLRLSGTGSTTNGFLFFDDIEVSLQVTPPTTTTTAPSTTTTTVTGSTTTTTLAGSTTTTTLAGSTTTTTAPGPPTTATSTTIPAESTVTSRPPRSGTASTTTTRSSDAVAVATTSTSTTTTSLDTTTTTIETVAASADLGGGGSDGLLSPIEGLSVAFSVASETIGETVIFTILLGLLVTGLTIVGLERRPQADPSADQRDRG